MMLKKLKTLKDDIVKYGVSQYDVNLLENEYGISILKDKYNINQFTKIKTDILKDVVIKEIDFEIYKLQKEKDSIDLNYIISSINLYKEYSDKLLELTEKYPLDLNKIDDSINGYLLKYYDDEGSIKNAQDLSIRKVFKEHVNILKSITDDNEIDSYIETYIKKYSHIDIFNNLREAIFFLKRNNVGNNYINIDRIKSDIVEYISKNNFNIDNIIKKYENTIFTTDKNNGRLSILNILYRIYKK